MTQAPTQSVVKRMIAAVKDAGVVVGLVEICPDGTIKIHHKDAEKKPSPKGPQSWE